VAIATLAVKPMNEHEHKAKVCGWLVKYGITEIFWEQKNDHGIPVFELELSTGRPDMLFRANDRWVVVEFKRGDRLTTALDAKYELMDYVKDFVHGSAKYKVNDQVVIPETFVVATGQSPRASVLDRMLTVEPRGYDNDAWPEAERFDTKSYVRDLWKLYKYEGFDYERHPTVGMLTSDRFAKPQTKYYQWMDDTGPWAPALMHNHRGGWYENI